jgi:hypothetical protein
MSKDGVGCKDCKRLKEHVASLLPFKAVESTQGKPLCKAEIAIAADMSRNFNVYTPILKTQNIEAIQQRRHQLSTYPPIHIPSHPT